MPKVPSPSLRPVRYLMREEEEEEEEEEGWVVVDVVEVVNKLIVVVVVVVVVLYILYYNLNYIYDIWILYYSIYSKEKEKEKTQVGKIP